MGCVIRGNTYPDSITFYHLNPILFHPSRKNTPDNDIIVTFDFHDPAPQNPDNNTF